MTGDTSFALKFNSFVIEMSILNNGLKFPY
jgi:hypothetical protein